MQWPSAGRRHDSETALPGVIETVGNAFALLNKRPYLMVLPMVLDLFLWLGYRLSLAPLTNTIVRWIGNVPSADASAITHFQSAGASFNLFELLAISTPTMVTRVGASAITGATTATISSTPWWLVAPLALLLVIAGVTIGVVYLTLLGYLVRGESLASLGVFRVSGMNTLRTIGYILLVIGVILLLSFPIALLTGALLVFGVSIAPLTAIFVFVGALWAYVLLYFAQDAIIISGAGPARAIYMSYNVVRANFWPCIGLMLVTLVIQIGTPLALMVFTRSAFGVPLAFLIHAYILTGLAVAAMLFYRDRASSLRVPKAAVTASDRTS